jgi:hypothetical protein
MWLRVLLPVVGASMCFLLNRRIPRQTFSFKSPHACPDPEGCPGGDRETHLLGVAAFRAANARYLFVNGTDRRANGNFSVGDCATAPACSDMSHQPDSAFEKIGEAAIAALGSTVKVVQFHGFLANNHNGDGNPPDDDKPLLVNYPAVSSSAANVVVSNGIGFGGAYPTTLATDVASAMNTAGFAVCLFNGLEPPQPQNSCGDLGATQNVLGRHIRRDNTAIADDLGQFVHIEAGESIRNDPAERRQLAEVVAGVMK